MESFRIVLKNEKQRSYRRIAIFILLLHFFYFLYSLVKVNASTGFIVCISFVTLSLILQNGSLRSGRTSIIPGWVSFLFLAVFWFVTLIFWLGLVLILLACLDLIAQQKMTVLFYADRVELPSFPRKTVRWNELANGLLKDRMLTLDFRNNHLLQVEISRESYDIDEKRFNDYCVGKINASLVLQKTGQ